MESTWTIGELAEIAGGVLAAAQPRQPSGRVREAPNDRLIRWYVTVGLVDPPLSRTGRIARYGRRHLLQLVAVKRRQAQGRSLAEIQAELVGATDSYLESVAQLPPAAEPGQSAPAARNGDRASEGTADERFWRRRPTVAPQAPAAAASRLAGPASAQDQAASLAGTRDRAGGLAVAGDQAAVHGIRLAPGVLLLLDAAGAGISPGDAQDLITAAGPLIAALTRLGYTIGSGTRERD